MATVCFNALALTDCKQCRMNERMDVVRDIVVKPHALIYLSGALEANSHFAFPIASS